MPQITGKVSRFINSVCLAVKGTPVKKRRSSRDDEKDEVGSIMSPEGERRSARLAHKRTPTKVSSKR